MADADNPKRGWPWFIICLVTFPLLYVLSIGPVAAIIEHTQAEGEWAQIVYAPIIWLDENTPLDRLIEGYINLWVKEPR